MREQPTTSIGHGSSSWKEIRGERELKKSNNGAEISWAAAQQKREGRGSSFLGGNEAET